MVVEGLDALLRELRESRRLSLSATARQAKVPKPTLKNWESGRSVPSGAGLSRLLDALEAEPRLRARLLHAADPVFARIELAHTPLSVAIDVGMVIRAMRERRGMTQVDLARWA